MLPLVLVLMFPIAARSSVLSPPVWLPAPDGLPGHSLLAHPLASGGRRNHDCRVVDGVAVLFAGRYNRVVEAFSLSTGDAVQWTPGAVLASNVSGGLDLNHVSSATVWRGTPSGQPEIWIPSGFSGDLEDTETSSLRRVLILSRSAGGAWDQLQAGPTLPRSVGGAGVAAVDLAGPAAPEAVCVFGGSTGSHRSGAFGTAVFCFDRAATAWVDLPPLPVPADHLSLARLRPGVCAPDEPPRLMVFNYRSSAHGLTQGQAYALGLRPDGDGAVRFPGEGGGNAWAPLCGADPAHGADAAPWALSPDGRLLFSFGGSFCGRASCRDKLAHATQVRVLDVCAQAWTTLAGARLDSPRYGLEACVASARSGDGANAAILCGGSSCFGMAACAQLAARNNTQVDAVRNLRSCEAFDLHLLAELARREGALSSTT